MRANSLEDLGELHFYHLRWKGKGTNTASGWTQAQSILFCLHGPLQCHCIDSNKLPNNQDVPSIDLGGPQTMKPPVLEPGCNEKIDGFGKTCWLQLGFRAGICQSCSSPNGFPMERLCWEPSSSILLLLAGAIPLAITSLAVLLGEERFIFMHKNAGGNCQKTTLIFFVVVLICFLFKIIFINFVNADLWFQSYQQ